MSYMSEQQSGLLIGAGTKEVLEYLSEHNHDAILEIVRDFPLAQSKDIIFANLSDKREYKAAIHDLNMALITQKARLPRTLKTQAEYRTAVALIRLRATRAIGPERDRVLAATARSEMLQHEIPKPKTGIRRLIHV